jgi:hypothetical protein
VAAASQAEVGRAVATSIGAIEHTLRIAILHHHVPALIRDAFEEISRDTVFGW